MCADDERELTTAEAAAYLGYTLRSFYKRTRDIPHRKFRGQLYFKVADLASFNESRTTRHVPVTTGDGCEHEWNEQGMCNICGIDRRQALDDFKAAQSTEHVPAAPGGGDGP